MASLLQKLNLVDNSLMARALCVGLGKESERGGRISRGVF